MTESSPPVPAATVVLFRDGADGLETLMLRRDSKVAFGGHWVFPGGKVEPDDRGDDGDQAAARRAAARETVEECGLVVAADDLVPIAHWVPPPIQPRRFATWFFVGGIDGSEPVVIDDSEIRDHRWLAPAGVLRLRDAGEVQLAPPTWMTLNDLAGIATVDDALTRAAGLVEIPYYETHWQTLGKRRAVALWSGDVAYDGGDVDAEGDRHRLWMDPDRWWLERT